MLRPLVISIFGYRVVVLLRSTTMALMPKSANTFASIKPTGPPPAIRTCVVFIGWRPNPLPKCCRTWRAPCVSFLGRARLLAFGNDRIRQCTDLLDDDL